MLDWRASWRILKGNITKRDICFEHFKVPKKTYRMGFARIILFFVLHLPGYALSEPLLPIRAYNMVNEIGAVEYSKLIVTDTPYFQNPAFPGFSKVNHIALKVFEDIYLQSHLDRDKTGNAKAFLDQVPLSPDKFTDGRSVFIAVLKGSVEDFFRGFAENRKVAGENVRALFRVSRSTQANPFLPFMMNLGIAPETFANPKFKHVQEPRVFEDIFLRQSSSFPYQIPEISSFPNRGLLFEGFGTELKSLLIKSVENEKRMDWLVHLVMGLEMHGLVSNTGFLLNRISGELIREGSSEYMEWLNGLNEIRSFRGGEIHPLDRSVEKGLDGRLYGHIDKMGLIYAKGHYAEVILSVEDYKRFRNTGKGSGLLKWYVNQLGFQEIEGFARPHPSHPEMYIVPLYISRRGWYEEIMKLDGRPGWRLLKSLQMKQIEPNKIVEMVGMRVVQKKVQPLVIMSCVKFLAK